MFSYSSSLLFDFKFTFKEYLNAVATAMVHGEGDVFSTIFHLLPMRMPRRFFKQQFLRQLLYI